MPLLMLKNLPRYECLLAAAKEFPDLDPSACEAFLHLLRAGDECFRAVESNLARHNISQGRFGVLMSLLNNCRGESSPTALSPAELADRTAVTRATMTGLIDTLERDGLVTRVPDTEDRRMMAVGLTEKARTLLHEILPDHFRRMTALMQSLDESERRTLVQLLNKIQEQAAAMAPPPAPLAATLS
ncbi:MAG: MarR family transcriptional regulator [Verrucomicrobia bacterium]|nr:MarR family transcriptional regulator [Verrucomicrobiota bacterium]